MLEECSDLYNSKADLTCAPKTVQSRVAPNIFPACENPT